MLFTRNKAAENRPHLSVTKHGYTSKSNLLKAFQCTLYRLKTSFRWHIMRKKSRLLLYVSYVLMSEWAYLCQNTIRQTINSSTCQPINFCKIFSKKFNTKSGLFIHRLPTLPQKKRFSRRVVLMQKGVGLWMPQNEFLFKKAVICTSYWAVYS